VHAETGIDHTTLYRAEHAKGTPQVRTLTALLDLYGVKDAPRRARFLALIKPSGAPAWLHAYDDLTDAYNDYVALEGDAATISNYESLFVPGLLQTEEYATAAIQGALPAATAKHVRRLVEVRMRRQAALSANDPLRLTTVVDEAAIRRVVGGPGVMAAQLRRLIEAPDHITLRVIPYGAGAHPGMSGSFAVMAFRDPDLSPVVYIDSMAGDFLLENGDAIARYTTLFGQVEAVALSRKDSVRLVADAAKRSTQ